MRSPPALLALTLALIAQFVTGCPSSKDHASPDQAVTSVPLATSYEPCALPPDDQPKPRQLFGASFTPRSAGVLEGPLPGKRLLLGVLGDTREALPATLASLDLLTKQFKQAGVMAVVLLGGIDSTFEGTRSIIGRLKQAGPVLCLPGDRASRSGFQAAVEAHQPLAVDMIKVRVITTPELALLAVPGYFLPHHLHAKEQGCSYGPEVTALSSMLRPLAAARLLLSHGPPRGDGPRAVDRAFGEVNAGDPWLRQLMIKAKIRFGLFAHFHESAGHATTLQGKPVQPMQWSNSLLLNVGAADSVPHQELRGQLSHGTAAIFELTGGRARYRMIALPALSGRATADAPSRAPAPSN